MTSTTHYPVWDSFIRGYHWLQVMSVAGLWYTGTEGLMDWHFAIAYFLLALLLTRLIWGVIGSETAQFRHFVRSPSTALQYLTAIRRGGESSNVGHNPAGAYMVVAFMLLLATQVTTGLFANDDIISEGPMAQYVSGELSSLMTSIHAINFNLILGAIALHVIAITAYLLRKDNLITPMITGKKALKANPPKMHNGLVAWGITAAIGSLIYFTWAEEVVAYLW